MQTTVGSTRYAMLDHGWDRLARLLSVCGYVGASAGFAARLHAHDAFAVDSVRSGVDGNRPCQPFTIWSCRSRCCRHSVASSTREGHCF